MFLKSQTLLKPIVIGLLLTSLGVAPSGVFAQSTAKSKKKSDDPALKPRRELLKSKDGVKLTSFYFPSDQGKEAVPVIVVHEWKGQAAPYPKLCMKLREAGFAVLLLEYRGHGNSRKFTNARGEEEDFNLATMSKRDIDLIIRYDIEEAKQFLKRENNAGRLNLNALSLIGVKEGAIIAAYWASRDWKIPSVGRMKQGQDVKGLVYVSPEKNLKGMAMTSATQDPNLIRLPTLLIAGGQSPQGGTAERIGSRIETIKKKQNRGSVKGYQLELPPTNLSGPALINDVSTVIPKIVSFLKENVSGAEGDNPWINRP